MRNRKHGLWTMKKGIQQGVVRGVEAGTETLGQRGFSSG
jgi:hypothetical protein